MTNEICETSSELAAKQCVPCQGGVPPLSPQEMAPLLTALGNDWGVVEEHHLSRSYQFPDFKEALRFTNLVGALAEDQGHHPDMLLTWGKVRVDIWTHKIDALVESDFIFAAKTEKIYEAK